MGAAYYIVLERDIAGLDTMMNGKSLARNITTLDKAAREVGVRPLSDFCSMPPDEVAEIMDVAVDPVSLPPLQEFSAREGLTTLRALMPRPEAQPALLDLKECERILSAAAEQGVGWHFQVDV
jgi:hypothetical protein